MVESHVLELLWAVQDLGVSQGHDAEGLDLLELAGLAHCDEDIKR